MDIYWHGAVIFVCLAAGGVLKGATGAGIGLVAIPIMAMLVDVRFALVVMLVPNLLTNIWQMWRYRDASLPGRFSLTFALGGAAGVIVGSYLLASLPDRMLLIFVAIGVFLYGGLRILRPDTMLSFALASRLSLPVGITAGVLQGLSGLSSPVSLSFLNFMRLGRRSFISAASVFFAVMAVAQIAGLALTGILTVRGMVLSTLAMLPVLLFLPLGTALGRRISPRNFDLVVLALLNILALKLVYDFLRF